MKKRQVIFFGILIFFLLSILFIPSAWKAQAAPMNAPQPPGTVKMVGCWSMDETSGTRFDSSPKGYNLLDGNTVGASAGHVGNSAEFITANREYLSHASNADLSGENTDMYWAGWVYSVPGMVNYGIILSKATVAGYWEYILFFGADNLGRFYISSGATPTTTYLSNYTWYFIEAKYDNAGHIAGLAINNSPWITAAAGTGITGNVGEFWIGGGAYSGGYQFWNGRIDEVVMYRRILNDDERAWLYNYGDGRSCANEVVATATATPSATPAITATPTVTATATPSATATPTSAIFPPIYTATSLANTNTPTQTANAITQIAANTATAASVGTATAESVRTANAATTTAIAVAATATATPAGSAAITSNAAPLAISIITVPAIISLNESNTNKNDTSGTTGGSASSSGSTAGSFAAVTPVPWQGQGQGGVAVFGGLSCGGYYIRARVYVDDNQDGMMSPAEGITGLQAFFLDQTYARLGSVYSIEGKAEFCIPVTHYGKTILIDIPYLQLFGQVQVPDQPNQDLEIWFPGQPPTLPIYLP